MIVSGCAAYTARPLRAPARQALRAPTQAALARAARTLKVPGLAPLKLDFRKPLTGQELGVIAVIANPALKALRARERVATAQVFAAGLLPNPVIQFSALKPYGVVGHTVALTEGFLWDVSRLVTRSTAVREARLHARSIDYAVAWREWVAANRTRLDARRLYWLRAESHLARHAQRLWRRKVAVLVRDARRHLIGGRRAAAFESAWDRLRLRVAALRRARRRARFRLDAELGLAPTARPLLAPPRPLPLPHASARTLFQRATSDRLDLVALVAAYHSADAGLLRAVLDQYPGLSIGPAGARNTSGISQVGFQLSLSLPLFGAGRGPVAIARARRATLFRDYVARLAYARAQIYRLHASARDLTRELHGLEGRRQALGRLTRAADASYKARALGFLSYLRLARELLRVRLQIAGLRRLRADTLVALQTATGTPWGGAA